MAHNLQWRADRVPASSEARKRFCRGCCENRRAPTKKEGTEPLIFDDEGGLFAFSRSQASPRWLHFRGRKNRARRI
jgi:hypothetical protein